MARALFTDRYGGQSTGPYRDFNLAFHVGDDPEVVARNRSLLAASLGIPATSLRFMNQIHGSRVAVAGTAEETAELPEADALFTERSGVALVNLPWKCLVNLPYMSAGKASLPALWRIQYKPLSITILSQPQSKRRLGPPFVRIATK